MTDKTDYCECQGSEYKGCLLLPNKEINTNLKYTKANIDINWFENIINLDDIEWKSLFELNLTNYPILLKKIKKTLDK